MRVGATHACSRARARNVIWYMTTRDRVSNGAGCYSTLCTLRRDGRGSRWHARPPTHSHTRTRTRTHMLTDACTCMCARQVAHTPHVGTLAHAPVTPRRTTPRATTHPSRAMGLYPSQQRLRCRGEIMGNQDLVREEVEELLKAFQRVDELGLPATGVLPSAYWVLSWSCSCVLYSRLTHSRPQTHAHTRSNRVHFSGAAATECASSSLQGAGARLCAASRGCWG